jgi:hypothetical protein
MGRNYPDLHHSLSPGPARRRCCPPPKAAAGAGTTKTTKTKSRCFRAALVVLGIWLFFAGRSWSQPVIPIGHQGGVYSQSYQDGEENQSDDNADGNYRINIDHSCLSSKRLNCTNVKPIVANTKSRVNLIKGGKLTKSGAPRLIDKYPLARSRQNLESARRWLKLRLRLSPLPTKNPPTLAILADLFAAVKRRLIPPAYADVPKSLNYQGRMTDSSDNLIDGTTYYYQFEIYDAASAGTRLWASYDDFASTCGVAITPSSGVFNVVIGDATVDNMSDLNINFDADPYYLQIKISATQSSDVSCEGTLGAGASYETLTPRQRIVSSGFAFTSRELSGDYNEKITNPTDDYLAFTGVGGADNTDLYLDLDGTYPVLYSNTDTAVGLDDNLTFVGPQSITTSSGALTIQPASGSNLNISLATTGDLAVNTDDLYVDTSAGRVGIGTTVPGYKLDVVRQTTDTPVDFAGQFKNVGDDDVLVLFNATTATKTFDMGIANSNFVIRQNGGYGLQMDTNGNVGIGTTGPGAKLHVVGSTLIADTTPPDLILDNTTTGADADSGRLFFRGNEYTNPTNTELDMSILLDIVSTTDYKLAFYNDGGAAGTEVATLDESGNLQLDGLLNVDGTGTSDIAGTLNLSGGALTSTGALTITPAAGSNLAIALSTTGDFTVNTDDLVVDTSAGYVGVNDATPSYYLDVNGTGRFVNTLYADGGVNTTSGNLTLDSTGGTTQVADNLDVTGNTTSTSGYADFGSYLRASEIRSEGDIYANYDGTDGDSNVYFYEGGSPTGEYLRWDDASGYGDGAGFYLSDDLELAGNIRKNVASSNLVINSAGASSGVVLQTGGTDKFTVSSSGDATLNSNTYGYLTFGQLASAPTGSSGRQYYNTTDDKMYYYDGNLSDWRAMQGVTTEQFAPEYENSLTAADGSNNTGTLVTGYEIDAGNNTRTFYKWTSNQGTLQDFDIILHARVPDNFVSWATNAITLNYKTGVTGTTDNYVYWEIYEDGNATALMTSANLASTSWATDSATSTELSALTAGDTFRIVIKLAADNTSSAAAYAGYLTLYYQ